MYLNLRRVFDVDFFLRWTLLGASVVLALSIGVRFGVRYAELRIDQKFDVVGLAPRPGHDPILRDAHFEVSFSFPLDVTRFGSRVVSLTGESNGRPIPLVLGEGADDHSLVVLPKRSLPPGETVLFEIGQVDLPMKDGGVTHFSGRTFRYQIAPGGAAQLAGNPIAE